MLLPFLIFAAFTIVDAEPECKGHLKHSPSCKIPVPSDLTVPCGSIDEEIKTLFFQIGDYGLSDDRCPHQVRELVKLFERHFGEADFLQSLGDNNYWDGQCHTMHKNVGALYSEYIPKPKKCLPYSQQKEAKWSDTARFWPTIGNHDWHPVLVGHKKTDFTYTQYFPYLGKLEDSKMNGGYYHKEYPFIELYSLNTNLDGNDRDEMLKWLEERLKKSTQPFQMIFGHHPAYSTALTGSIAPWLQEPLGQHWTQHQQLYFSGHEHVYERLTRNNSTYVINGLGGHPWRYAITDEEGCVGIEGSKVRYNAMHGAVVGWATETKLEWCMYNVKGEVVDHAVLPTRASGVKPHEEL